MEKDNKPTINWNIELSDIKLQKAGNRRRKRTQPVSDGNIICRSDRINKRNILLSARFYYWTEIKRKRFDDVLHILADAEFFIDPRTVSNILVEKDEYLTELIRNKTSRRRLKNEFPGFDWD